MTRPTDCAWEEITTISQCRRLTDPCFCLPMTSWQGATQVKLGLVDNIKAEPTHPQPHQKTPRSILIEDQHLRRDSWVACNQWLACLGVAMIKIVIKAVEYHMSLFKQLCAVFLWFFFFLKRKVPSFDCSYTHGSLSKHDVTSRLSGAIKMTCDVYYRK